MNDFRGIFFILSFLLFWTQSWGQDERTFREMLFYKKKREDLERVKSHSYKYGVTGSRYLINLIGDERPESFFVAKRDGQDWLEIQDDRNKKIYEFKFDTLGPKSRVYRVQKRMISKDSTLLIFYFFEGVTKYINFRGTSRVYFLAWDKSNKGHFSMFKGPYIWDEQRTAQDHYHQRKFEVSLYDFDRDGAREVAVRYGGITRVFKYLGSGQWGTYSEDF